MKKYITALLLGALLLFAAGCDDNTADNDPAAPAAEEAITAQENDGDNEAAKEDGSEGEADTAGVLSAEEIKALYEKAEEVYQWFDLEPLAMETDESGATVFYNLPGGMTCGAVKDDRIASMAELEAAVRGCFADAYGDKLLDSKMYIEEDGVLYELIADRGTDITRGDIIAETVTNATETDFTYTITVETVDPETDAVTGSEDIDFVAEKINGKWLFTQFSSIY